LGLRTDLIALRDDTALLKDPANLILPDPTRAPGEEAAGGERATLYPDGFSARRFVGVIEQAAIWQHL